MIAKQRAFSSAENAVLNVSRKFCGFFRVGEILHLRGPFISLDALRTAVGCLQRRHPFLRSRLKNNPGSSNTYLMEEDSTLRLKIREIPRKRDQHLQFWKQEWREREKDIPIVGEGLAEFWLLQDPDDREDDQAPREIIIICEHCICDGLSLSTVAHELLLALGEEDKSLFKESLDWPVSMETAIERSLSRWNRFTIFSKFLLNMLYWQMTLGRKSTRLPFADVDFSLNDMCQHCHTEISSGTLNKDETQRLYDKCHQHNVTMNSAISSAILRALSIEVVDKTAPITYAVPADVRRRCSPPIPNHDLSYQVAGTAIFSIVANDTPTTVEGMWQLAKTFGEYINSSISRGDVMALGMMLGKIYENDNGLVSGTSPLTGGITNWGRLPFQERYGQWDLLEMTSFGNGARSPTPIAVVYTVNGVLTISFSTAAPIISANVLQNIKDNTMTNLHSMMT